MKVLSLRKQKKSTLIFSSKAGFTTIKVAKGNIKEQVFTLVSCRCHWNQLCSRKIPHMETSLSDVLAPTARSSSIVITAWRIVVHGWTVDDVTGAMAPLGLKRVASSCDVLRGLQSFVSDLIMTGLSILEPLRSR